MSKQFGIVAEVASAAPFFNLISIISAAVGVISVIPFVTVRPPALRNRLKAAAVQLETGRTEGGEEDK